MTKSKAPERFIPELDGQGRVLAPVKKKHLPKATVVESSLGAALRQAMSTGPSGSEVSAAMPKRR